LRIEGASPELLNESELDFRYFTKNSVTGLFLQNTFRADLRFRIALLVDQGYLAELNTFLDDNPFQSLMEFGDYQDVGHQRIWYADVFLGSAMFLKVTHEMITFAIRSKPAVVANVRAEVFDENGIERQFGGLTSGAHVARRWFTYHHPETHETIIEDF
jgi:hypothetical protein